MELGECWKGGRALLLWNLWEIMVSEIPLLIITDTPQEASYF